MEHSAGVCGVLPVIAVEMPVIDANAGRWHKNS
jgi:hypothetical protein